MSGTSHPQMLWAIGKLKNRDVTVLIDGGSTHNFIDEAVATKFSISIVSDKCFQVMVGNGDKMECKGCCMGLTLRIQNYPIITNFYVLPVAACQVVLGVQWLETLGPFETDYRQLRMSFKRNGQQHVFQGLTQPALRPLKEKEFYQLTGKGYLLQVTLHTNETPTESEELPADLVTLLDEFAPAFAPLATLPPKRPQDHSIILKENQAPNWPIPTTVKGVRGFLGLAGYFRKFIRGFGSIVAPLTQLPTKDGFKWTPDVEEAFNKLKATLTSSPVLKLPDFDKPFIVECDACGTGIGAILSQNNQPIAIFSEALKGSSLSLSTYDKEMLAVVKAIRKWRPYLLGRPFIVRTDQRSLKYLLEQRISTPTQNRWLPKLLGYDYQIQYKRGVDNQGADALSRQSEFYFHAVSRAHADWWPILQQETSTLPYFKEFKSTNDYLTKSGVLFKQGRIVISPTSSLIPGILSDNHSSPMEKIWSDISMDFVERLPPSKSFDVIMVVVDRLRKYAHFVSLRHPFMASSVAKEFITHIVKLHGFPSSIISDRDKVFISYFWKTLFTLHDTLLCLSSSYHPQIDGQMEVVNHILEQYLRCYTHDRPHKWVDWLPWAEFSYNTSVHSATKLSPFEVVYGIPPLRLNSYILGTTNVQVVDEILRTRADILNELRLNLTAARNRMKQQADLHRRNPYRQNSVAFRLSLKLSVRYFGPYEVIGRVGPVAYRLRLPEDARIHNVFHISLLKKHNGPLPSQLSPLPVSEDSTLIPQPEAILDRREEILVKWEGALAEDAT
ncbi:hypothetical protein K2173_012046 [Erythroxylum novogranatense]|uniref:Integrase catalytic domain-containing protein n=1 Tax=Erythroxylum novogranatense TaxID=1862640 RepID=A0AAV8TGN3_9ROSI|nr:hypothetical protein K2173_012046 [Erythroxylum novogranatense]